MPTLPTAIQKSVYFIPRNVCRPTFANKQSNIKLAHVLVCVDVHSHVTDALCSVPKCSSITALVLLFLYHS